MSGDLFVNVPLGSQVAATTVTLRGYYSDVETDIGSNGQIAPGERGADGTPNLGRFTVAHLQRPNKTCQSDVGLTLQWKPTAQTPGCTDSS